MTIGPPTPERTPSSRMSAATTPPTSSKSSILTGRTVCSICPSSPRPASMAAPCPTGSGGASPSDQLATTSAQPGFTTRNRVPRCAPSKGRPATPAVVSRTVSVEPFVPDDFDPPRELKTPEFHLEPLGPQHNESDHVAWTSSIAHIRALPASSPGAGRRSRACRSTPTGATWKSTRATSPSAPASPSPCSGRAPRRSSAACTSIPPRAAAAMRRSAPGFALTSPSWMVRCTPPCRAGSSSAGHSSA